MKLLILLITNVLIALTAYSQSDEIQEDWIRSDSLFISALKQQYFSNPLSVDRILKPNKKERTKLGYGYSLIDGSNGKGYVSIFYTLVYKEGKLISYHLEPEMPRESILIPRYLKFYQGLFEINHFEPFSFDFNYQKMTDLAFTNNTSVVSSEKVQYFMTPYSGIVYGNYGGIASTMLKNRKAFNAIKNTINEDLLMLLLHSINPASRLSAAEFYYQNKDKFKQQDLIESIIIKNLKELPNIDTMNGCFRINDNAKKVLDQMIKENN